MGKVRGTKDTPLTAKQLAFIRYFIELNDAQAAAIKAGYSERSAKELGYQLLQRPNVAAAVAAEREKLNKRTRRNLVDVVAEIETIAFVKLVDKGLIKDTTKLDALKTLGHHLGMFTGSDELKVQRAVEQLLDRIRERVPVEAYDRVVQALAAEMGLPELGEQESPAPAANEGAAGDSGPVTH